MQGSSLVGLLLQIGLLLIDHKVTYDCVLNMPTSHRCPA